MTVTTNGSGVATFNTTLSGVVVPAGAKITATATVDLGGSYGATSEFSQNFIPSFIGTPGVTISVWEPQPLGNEYRVNQTVGGDQWAYYWSVRTVAMHSDGSYVHIWIDTAAADGSQYGIFGRMYNADGTPQTGEFVVNGNTTGSQDSGAVSMAPDGSFVVMWFGPGDGNGNGVFGRRFAADGTAIGAEFQVNTTTVSNQKYPELDFAADGSFVAAWVTQGSGGTERTMLQRFDANASKVGGEVQLDTGSGNDQVLDSLFVKADGSFVVTWTEAGDVYGRRYAANITPQGAAFRINQYTSDTQQYSVARADAAGNFVVVWESAGQDGSGSGIYGRRYAPNGTALGNEFQITPQTAGDQYAPTLAMDSYGNFVVAWTDGNAIDGSGDSIWMRRFDSSGNAVGTPIQVNQTSAGYQAWPVMDLNDDGRLIIAWEGNGPGDDYGVYGRRYQLNPTLLEGTTQQFTVVLNTAPTSPVTLNISVSDSTEAALSSTSLIFDNTNWSLPQTVTITGLEDGLIDGDVALTIVTANTISSDPLYSNLSLSEIPTLIQDSGSLNAPPTITSNSGGATAAVSVAENTTAVTTVTATDADLPAQMLTYSITGGADATKFSIDSNTGTLTFALAPDFDVPGDVGGNNVYDVQVTVSDGAGLTDLQDIAVTVTNSNEVPTVSAISNQTIDEEGSTGALAFTVGDPETVPGTLSITASSSNTAIIPVGNLVLGGSGANRTITVNPADNQNGGPVTITVSVSDGTNTTQTTFTVTVNALNDAPVITANTLSITEGATVVLSNANINTTDPDTVAANLTYTASGISGGQFELVSAPGTAVITFTQEQINNGDVQFVHGGGDLAPTYDLTVNDGSLSNGPSTVTIGTFTEVNDAPTITTNALSITEGATVVLSNANINTTDPDNTPAQLTYTMSGISGGQFEYVSVPDVAVTTFTQEQINNGEVQFVHDGGNLAPAYDLTVSDGALSHGPSSASVTFIAVNDVPTISAVANQTVNEDTTLGPLSFTIGDSETAAASLIVTATTSDGTRIPNGNIVLGGSGTNRTVTITPAPDQNGGPATITLTVSDGVASTQTSFDVTITPVNDAPTISSASYNVMENTPNGFVFGTISSGDIDAGDPRTYAIIGGDPMGAFVIDSSTGALSVADSAQLDYETTTGWTLTIEVRDAGGLTAITDVPITLVDENDNPPIITSNAGGDTASIGITENNTAVTTVAAIDADSGPGVTYGMYGDDAGLFQIDTNTGVLTFLAAPDHELPQDLDSNNVYEVTVVATDGLYSDTQDLSITATDQDEFNTTAISDTDAASETLAENLPVGSAVGVTAFADDLDGTDTVSYSLTNNAGGRFTIDPFTGGVTLSAALDFETATSHSIQIQALSTDGSTSIRDFVILVTDVNETSITSISDTDATIDSVNEAAGMGTPVGIMAFADDLDGTDTVSYSLLDDAGGLFAIDANTGEITLAGGLDYELETSHTIRVQALSTDGTSSLRDFTISVTDVDEYDITAITDNDGTSETISESITMGTPVGITAFANDLDGTDTVSYSLLDDAGGLFAINANTGEITLAGGLDYELETSHTIRVQALSTDGTSSLRDFTISVTDVDEYDITAITDLDTGTNDVVENAAVGSTVGITAIADDFDGTDSVTYSLLDDAGGLFAIDLLTGVVTVANPIDYEASTSHTITVQATSTDLSTSSLDYIITVTDQNDNTPLITLDQSFTIPENAPNGTLVGVVLAVDVDILGLFQNWQITGGTGSSAFAINPLTGLITVQNGTFLDFETTASWTLSVSVFDGIHTAVDETVTIDLSNVNEAPILTAAALPITEGGSYVFTASDIGVTDPDHTPTQLTWSVSNLTGGQFEFITTPSVPVTTFTQADVNANLIQFIHNGSDAAPTFSLTVSDAQLSVGPQVATISFISVNDAPTISVISNQSVDEDTTLSSLNFTVDDSENLADTLLVTATSSNQSLISDANLILAGTGANRTLTLAPSLNQNGGPVTITMTVSDGAITTVRTFTVNITPVNDLPVVGPQTLTLTENASAGTVVGGIIATDVDAGATLNYSIVGGNSSGAFAIDATTGIITVYNPDALDFESQPTFSLLISVTDGIGVPQSTTTTMDLLDLNELPTTLNLIGGTVNENSSSGTFVGQLTSTDVDAGDSATYTLIDDAGGLFAVDPVTGEVTVRGSLDYETATNHVITARITDQGGLALDRSFVLSLLDLNEAPVLVGGALSLAENPSAGILVGTVLASDVDAGDELQFSLAAGNTSGAFAIDPLSGDITVMNPVALDFETNPLFTLTIQVADRAGLTDQQTLSISLIDLNEQPVVLDGDYRIPEWSALGHVVGAVMASDVDAGDLLRYTFLSGNTGGRFAIDPVNGQITLADSTAFTYESQSTFLLTVQVTDIAGLTDLAATTIHVDNVNLPPMAQDDRYTMKQFESLVVPLATGVMANDGDSDSPQITWTLLQSPLHGSLNIAADGSFSYIPDNMFFGVETFSYVLSDGFESSAVATVSIEVHMAAPGDAGNTDGNTSDTGSGSTDDSGSTGDQESTTNGNGTGPVAPPSTPPQSTGTPSIRSFTSDILWPAPSNHPVELQSAHSLMEGVFEDKETRSGHRNAISFSDRLSGIPGYAAAMNSLPFTTLPDLTEAVLRNQTLWDGLNTFRDSLNEHHESAVTFENIVVGTTTAVTGSLTVGYVIWLIRGGSLLATMMSVMPTWMSFDPLPVMDRFEEDQIDDDTESLASIVSGRAQ